MRGISVELRGKPKGSPPIYGGAHDHPIAAQKIATQKVMLLVYINLVATVGFGLVILSAIYRLH